MKSREQRRAEARARLRARAQRTPAEQLARKDAAGLRALRERERLKRAA